MMNMNDNSSACIGIHNKNTQINNISSSFNDGSKFCGFLNLELPNNNNVFVRKYFVLDEKTNKLYYYSTADDNTTHVNNGSAAEGCFNVSFISLAGDASSYKPKVSHCLYITVSGTKHFLKADNDREKLLWIEKLQNASRVHVPSTDTLMNFDDDSCFKVEVVGGVILKTQMDEDTNKLKLSSSSSSSLTLDDSVKSGFCFKQGAVRKNWKKRFFKLSKSCLQYFRTQEDENPLRTIFLKDVLEVRPSVGIHLSKDCVFEIVTSTRVFYIQPNSELELRSWMSAISKCLIDINGPKILDMGIQTDYPSYPSFRKSNNQRLQPPPPPPSSSSMSSSSSSSYTSTFI